MPAANAIIARLAARKRTQPSLDNALWVASKKAPAKPRIDPDHSYTWSMLTALPPTHAKRAR
jgi:hypothetical protein